MEFIYLVFTRRPGRATLGDSGLCCCVPCMYSKINSLCWLKTFIITAICLSFYAHIHWFRYVRWVASLISSRVQQTASSRKVKCTCISLCCLLYTHKVVAVKLAFASLARILVRRLDHSLPTCPFFFLFSLIEISSRTLIPLFRPGSVRSGSVSWNDRGQVFLDELSANSFPDRFPHYAWTVA